MNARVATSSEIDISNIQFVMYVLVRHNFKFDYSVDTFDVDNTTVTGGSNELEISISYIKNTSARGVLLVLVHNKIIDGGGVDLSLSVYRVVERVQLRSNDEFRNITNGTYRVLAYDNRE